MRIGMIGLGRMGANMSRRLALGGIDVVAFDANAAARTALDGVDHIATVASLDLLVDALAELPAGSSVGASGQPRIVWMMLPSGDISQQTIDRLGTMLTAGDLVIDGANAWYKDSMRHAGELAPRGIEFIDAGVSGGVWGLENGYALMVGGDAGPIARATPLFRVLAPGPDRGWLHCGPAGAGHFVKMIHNGVEYGMMQAYAEGLSLIRGKTEFAIDVSAVAEMWRHGSVVRSWLLDLTADALAKGTSLDGIKPYVADSGEGRWTAIEAIEQGVPAPVMSLALMMRFASQGSNDYGSKLLALMRAGFGGHAVQHMPADAAPSDAAPAARQP